jgi:hypothetical protein
MAIATSLQLSNSWVRIPVNYAWAKDIEHNANVKVIWVSWHG